MRLARCESLVITFPHVAVFFLAVLELIISGLLRGDGLKITGTDHLKMSLLGR